MTFEEFIMAARNNGASDIHMTVGAPTVFRINGNLVRLNDMDDQVVNRTILSMLTAEQEQRLNAGEDLDFVFEISTGARQRVNVFHQMGKLAASIRLLNAEVQSLDDLGFPHVLTEFAQRKSGLILVTGPTGSGKTTTLAAMIDYINKNRACHIITIEDPVEYRYKPDLALIHQREVGADVKTFDLALRSALREDPDVIFVGEMRDFETIQLAVTAAETGHLVLATLHTKGAAETVGRIIDACPPMIRSQMLVQIAQTLEGVVSQVLIPTADGNSRVCGLEVLVGTDAVKNLIRADKCHNLETAMQQGARNGMIVMDDYIYGLYKDGKINRQAALEFRNDRSFMSSKLGY